MSYQHIWLNCCFRWGWDGCNQRQGILTLMEMAVGIVSLINPGLLCCLLHPYYGCLHIPTMWLLPSLESCSGHPMSSTWNAYLCMAYTGLSYVVSETALFSFLLFCSVHLTFTSPAKSRLSPRSLSLPNGSNWFQPLQGFGTLNLLTLPFLSHPLPMPNTDNVMANVCAHINTKSLLRTLMSV